MPEAGSKDSAAPKQPASRKPRKKKVDPGLTEDSASSSEDSAARPDSPEAAENTESPKKPASRKPRNRKAAQDATQINTEIPAPEAALAAPCSPVDAASADIASLASAKLQEPPIPEAALAAPCSPVDAASADIASLAYAKLQEPPAPEAALAAPCSPVDAAFADIENKCDEPASPSSGAAPPADAEPCGQPHEQNGISF
jgi:hypothetical protein